MTGRRRSLPEHMHLVRGRFYTRIVVPDALRGVLGKTQLSRSLGTDRVEATRVHWGVVAEFLKILDAARGKTAPDVVEPTMKPLTPHQMARLYYVELVAFDEQLRSTDHRYARFGHIDEGHVRALREIVSGAATNDEIRDVLGGTIEAFRERRNTSVVPGTTEWRALAHILARAELEALARIAERDEGDFAGEPRDPIMVEPVSPAAPATLPVTVVPKSAPIAPPLKPPVSFSALVQGYTREAQATGGGKEAERRWKPVFANFEEYLRSAGKLEDFNLVNKSDIIGWKDELMESELALKTIKDVYLAAVRAVLRWSYANDRIDNNPAATVYVKAPKNGDEDKGHSDAEAKAILRAATAHKPINTGNPATTESPYLTKSKNWIPWLLALTGARVAEMAQLRVEDVYEREGVPCILITPKAGSVKNGKQRYVPIHEQLINRGFLEFVENSNGALFYDISAPRDGKTHPAKNIGGKISEWLRPMGIVAEDVAPNHGWRHRFKTIGRELEIDPRVIDAIQGHAGRTASDDYGTVSIRARKNAIDRMPFYDVD